MLKVQCTHLAVLLAVSSAMPLAFTSCDSAYHYEVPPISGIEFDPSQPVTVSAIMPDSGGYLTPFIISGSNFGMDASKITVIFNGNRQATVVNTNGTEIYGVTPKQENGANQITVQVDSAQAPTVCPERFQYNKVERVSVLAGKTGSNGYVDGNLIDSRFNYIQGVGVVAGNNLLVCEGKPRSNDGGHRVRMISESENKVTTLYSGTIKFGHPAVTSDGKRAYVIECGKPNSIYYFDQANSWNAKKLTDELNVKRSGNGDIYACTFADDDRYLYFRNNEGKFGYVDTQNPDDVTILNNKCGAVDKSVSHIAWSPVDKCFYLAVWNHNAIYKVSKDGKTVEEWVGFNGVGGDDGPRLQCKLANPTGMVFDDEGNMYWTDSYGYTVRKLSHADGMVTTVVGQYRKQSSSKVEGLPLENTLYTPWDIARDSEGNFYIVEVDGRDVRKYAIE